MTTAALHTTPGREARRWWSMALWLAFTLVLLLAVRSLPWTQVLLRLREARGEWIMAAVAANFAILPLWASEWRLLVPAAFRVGYGRMFEVVSVTASVLNAVPMLAGEASAVGLLILRAGLSRGAALSVLALDQLLVAFAKLATIAAAATMVSLPAWLRAGVISLAAAFIALLLLLGVVAHHWQALSQRVALRETRARAAAVRLMSWGGQLDALRDGRIGAAAALAIAKKSMELLAIIAVQLAFGVEPSFAAGLLVLAALAVTTLLPVAPANLGVYEATVFAAYRYMGVSADAALGMAIVQHAAFLLPSLATGYLTATAARLRRGRP